MEEKVIERVNKLDARFSEVVSELRDLRGAIDALTGAMSLVKSEVSNNTVILGGNIPLLDGITDLIKGVIDRVEVLDAGVVHAVNDRLRE